MLSKLIILENSRVLFCIFFTDIDPDLSKKAPDAQKLLEYLIDLIIYINLKRQGKELFKCGSLVLFHNGLQPTFIKRKTGIKVADKLRRLSRKA